MSFVVEKIDPYHELVADEEWTCETAYDAAVRVDSEASPQNWPVQEIAAELQAEGRVELTDEETGVEVIARRT